MPVSSEALLEVLFMPKLFEKCPSCGGPIVITECICPDCKLVMRSEFTQGIFSTLSDDQITFIRSFLRVRGNLSELEKVLGISYPTIRNKLDEINQLLDQADLSRDKSQEFSKTGGETASAVFNPERQAVLQQVAAGKINVPDAIQLLRNLKGDA
jgi:hypothetical protein